MKAAIIFTGTGPLLVLTSYPSFDDPSFLNKLKAKGIRKFISCEVPIEGVGLRRPPYLSQLLSKKIGRPFVHEE
jgi:hypothetical protein